MSPSAPRRTQKSLFDIPLELFDLGGVIFSVVSMISVILYILSRKQFVVAYPLYNKVSFYDWNDGNYSPVFLQPKVRIFEGGFGGKIVISKK